MRTPGVLNYRLFGGRALSGTPKQRKWATVIRDNMLSRLSENEAVAICTGHPMFSVSRFWIEHREKSADTIGALAVALKTLITEAAALKSAGENAQYEQVAKRYNLLVEEWVPENCSLFTRKR